MRRHRIIVLQSCLSIRLAVRFAHPGWRRIRPVRVRQETRSMAADSCRAAAHGVSVFLRPAWCRWSPRVRSSNSCSGMRSGSVG